MKIKWEVDDGYAGPSAPHYTTIDDDEIAECETEEEKRQFITDCVQEDFQCNIAFIIDWARVDIG